MRKLLVLSATLILAGLVHADPCGLYGTCDRNGYYGSSEERVWRGSTDLNGNEVWTDNRGTTIRSWQDHTGATIYQNRYGGDQLRCKKDWRGDTVCRVRPSPYGSLYR